MSGGHCGFGGGGGPSRSGKRNWENVQEEMEAEYPFQVDNNEKVKKVKKAKTGTTKTDTAKTGTTKTDTAKTGTTKTDTTKTGTVKTDTTVSGSDDNMVGMLTRSRTHRNTPVLKRDRKAITTPTSTNRASAKSEGPAPGLHSSFPHRIGTLRDGIVVDSDPHGASSKRKIENVSTGTVVARMTKREAGAGAYAGKAGDVNADAKAPPLKCRRGGQCSSSPDANEVRLATFLQRSRTIKLAIEGEKFGMSSAVAKASSYDDLASLLHKTERIKVMKRILHRVCVLTADGARYIPNPDMNTGKINVRVFVASFLIVYHPTRVFDSVNDVESKLRDAAIEMLNVFEKLTTAIRALGKGGDMSDIVAKALSFPLALNTYIKAFNTWKIPDAAKLTDRIRHALIALNQAEDHLVEGEADTPRLREEFQAQQTRLSSKLVQINSNKADAMKVIKEINDIRVADGKKLSRALTSVGTDKGSSSMGTDGGSSSGGGFSALPRRMTNEQLAHEVLIDPTFQLDTYGSAPGENYVKIRASFEEAYWKSLADDLRLPTPCYARISRTLVELRDGIHDMGPKPGDGSSPGVQGCGYAAALEIVDVIDMDLIKQQTDKGCLEWSVCVKLIHDVMSIIFQLKGSGGFGFSKFDVVTSFGVAWDDMKKRMEASEADMTARPDTFCRALKLLLDCTKAARVGIANSRLRLVAPVLKDHGVEYEKNHMANKLRMGTHTLTRTRTWLHASINQSVQSGDVLLNDLNGHGAVRQNSFRKVIMKAVTVLATKSTPIRVAECPEVFLLDITHMANHSSRFRDIVQVASMLVIIGQRIGPVPGRTAVLESIVNRVMPVVHDAKDVTSMLPIVQATLVEFTQMSKTDSMGLLSELLKGLSGGDTVPVIMRKRLQMAVLMSLESKYDELSSASAIAITFNKVNLPKCSYAIGPCLRAFIAKLRRNVSLNMRVHETRYNTLVAGVARNLIMFPTRLDEGASAPPGFRKVEVSEAMDRLDELTKTSSLKGASILRLGDGRLDLIKNDFVELEDGSLVGTGEKWIKSYDKVEGRAQTLVIPLTFDIIKLEPSASPPTGFRLVSYLEAKSEYWNEVLVRDWLQKWSIVRLCGGKIDGTGYGALVTSGDFSQAPYIGEALVTKI
jgi:hypothetical protein